MSKKKLATEDFTIEESILIERLRSYRVPGMVEEYKKQLQDPNSDLLPFHERLSKLVNAEWFKRYNKKLNAKLKVAKLRYPDATLDETIYDPSRVLDTETIELLADCKWIETRKNLLIT